MNRPAKRADDAGRVEIARLVAEHHADVYRYAFRLSGAVADAEDLVQESFLLAQQRIGQLRDRKKARPWLLAIVRNCFLGSLRRRRPIASSDLEFEMEDIPHHDIESAYDFERLPTALDALPDEFRVVVLMFYFEFLSYREIAQQLDLPVGTVMSRLARGKQRLRKHLVRTSTTPSTDDPRPAHLAETADAVRVDLARSP